MPSGPSLLPFRAGSAPPRQLSPRSARALDRAPRRSARRTAMPASRAAAPAHARATTRRGRRDPRSARRTRRTPRGCACRGRARPPLPRTGSRCPSSRSWWSRTSRCTPAEKPPSSPSSRVPHSACSLTTAYSVVRERAGFLRISSGTCSLPMSCSSPPDREPRRRGPARPSASPTSTARSATRRVCSFRVGVLLGEGDHQRAHVRAEERLLLGDELGAACRSPASGRDCALRVRSSATADRRRRAMPSSSSPWPSHQPSSRQPSSQRGRRAPRRARRCRPPRGGRRPAPREQERAERAQAPAEPVEDEPRRQSP